MGRVANPDYSIHPLLVARYSPYAFDPTGLAQGEFLL